MHEFGKHQMKGGLVDSKIRLQRAYSVNEGRGPAQPFKKSAPYRRPDVGASLIMTLLLALGLWAAIWGAVYSLTSTVLR
jgi:hypothetical protein